MRRWSRMHNFFLCIKILSPNEVIFSSMIIFSVYNRNYYIDPWKHRKLMWGKDPSLIHNSRSAKILLSHLSSWFLVFPLPSFGLQSFHRMISQFTMLFFVCVAVIYFCPWWHSQESTIIHCFWQIQAWYTKSMKETGRVMDVVRKTADVFSCSIVPNATMTFARLVSA